MLRIEVWFTSGLFRAFPKVKRETMVRKNDFLVFTFGDNEHVATIDLTKIDFTEEFDDNSEE